MGFVNDSTRCKERVAKEEENNEKELRAMLSLQEFAAFARGVYREDGQQGNEQKQGEVRFHIFMIHRSVYDGLKNQLTTGKCFCKALMDVLAVRAGGEA